MNGLILITGYNTAKQSVETYLQKGGNFAQPFPGYENFSLVTLVIGISLFELFRRLKVPCLRFVNFLGGATFMVYLLHDNSLFYSLWGKTNWPQLLYRSPAQFALELALVALGTFALGVLVYWLYVGLEKLCARGKGLVLSIRE